MSAVDMMAARMPQSISPFNPSGKSGDKGCKHITLAATVWQSHDGCHANPNRNDTHGQNEQARNDGCPPCGRF